MRIVSFFRKDDKIWVSPSSLWSAIQSGELLGVLKPPGVTYETILASFYDAAAILKQKWLFGIKSSIISAIWCTFFTLLLFWPPLAAKMPKTVREVLLFGLGMGIGAEIASTIMILHKRRLLINGKARLIEALDKRAISLKLPPPAAFYRSGADFSIPKAKVAIFALLAIILLNSVVLAFPARPAVISGSYIVKRPILVFPGTKWEWRKEYHTGSIIGLLAVPEDEKSIWVVRIAYRAWHSNMLRDPGPWHSWMSARLNWLVSRISEEVWQDFAPEMSQDERAAEMVAVFQNPELRDVLKEVLTNHFNEHHEGIMKLSVVRLEIVEMPIGDYISAYKKQQEE